ncbi:acyltransferase [Flavobacterium sp. SUN052]|uniref:acyltransferase family protein n=1 Tax=Flavobacterium sp. SUN052 TaxID=3002441 RepID=UPI00237D8E14|nr:acyltransferase [Flavobacterium sp. SUN052]MEC4004655.1 acyltransferase [Flavobacterium sp. SUN052]
MSKSSRFQELDALRGIAALMVVLFHYTMTKPQAKLGFELGTTGVDLFFIISGFVIFMSLTKVKTSLDFIINRVSRLYPTYWACVTFTFLLILIVALNNNQVVPLKQYVGNMTMFQYYLGITDLDGPYWTMIIEMIFYIGIVLLFHFKKLKYLNIIGLTLSLCIVLLTSFFNNATTQWLLKYIPLLQYIPLFFAGTIFYKCYTEQTKAIENYSILLLCLICQILLFNYCGRSKTVISQVQYTGMLIVYFVLFVLFVNKKLGFIVSKLTLFLGKISFALYLIHQHVSIRLILPLLINKYHINFWVATFCITLPIVLVLASLITYFIDVPMSKKMKQKLHELLG